MAVKGLANGSFAYQAQECSSCPAARYCPGGADSSIPCPEGTFSLPGTAAALFDCLPATFISITIQVDAPPPIATQPALLKAIASAASVSKDTVSIIGATARDGNASVVQLRIAAGGIARAHEICASLESTSMRLGSALPDDPVCLVLTCALDGLPLSTSSQMLTIVMIATAFGAFLCTIYVGILYKRQNSEESEVMKATKQLRLRLRIERRDGYRVDSDWIYPWQNISKAMHINKRCIESAIKLSLLRDFNTLEFDAFCVCLIRPEHQNVGRSIQHIALFDWILEISKWLLKPSIKVDKATINPETGREWTERERFSYLKKLCQCQVY
jgi:hypothetical protein